MERVAAWRQASQPWITWAMTSGPLSLRRSAGAPCVAKSRSNPPITRTAGSVVGGDLDRQALARELVHHGQQLERGAVEATSVMHEIVGPHVPRMRRLGGARCPRPRSMAPPPPRWLAHVQLGGSPEAMHTLAIDRPALAAQQRPHAPLAVARRAPRQRGDARREFVAVGGTRPRVVLDRRLVRRPRFAATKAPVRRSETPCATRNRTAGRCSGGLRAVL